jgi:threonine dehydrogenase-like Zn-dependent dehydrogenase
MRSTGPCGVCTWTAGAIHRTRTVPAPIYELCMNAVTFRTGWMPSRALVDEPLQLIASGLFDPTEVATRHAVDDAEAAFAEPFTKLIFELAA